MRITQSEAIQRLAERVQSNKEYVDESLKQRRNQVTDIYGQEFTRIGDAEAPAEFRLSVSPQLVYHERFQFKLIIQPFVATTADNGVRPATGEVEETRLSLNNNAISPNPHTHDTKSHTHSIVRGVSFVPTTSTNWTVKMEDIDITPYLIAQYGEWINGEGIFPTEEINHDYDILEVASDLEAEGRSTEANKLLTPGYKKIEVISDAPFQVTLVLYLRYSHYNA